MSMNEKELLERDEKRDIGQELLTAIRDVKAVYWSLRSQICN